MKVRENLDKENENQWVVVEESVVRNCRCSLQSEKHGDSIQGRQLSVASSFVTGFIAAP